MMSKSKSVPFCLVIFINTLLVPSSFAKVNDIKRNTILEEIENPNKYGKFLDRIDDKEHKFRFNNDATFKGVDCTKGSIIEIVEEKIMLVPPSAGGQCKFKNIDFQRRAFFSLAGEMMDVQFSGDEKFLRKYHNSGIRQITFSQMKEIANILKENNIKLRLDEFYVGNEVNLSDVGGSQSLTVFPLKSLKLADFINVPKLSTIIFDVKISSSTRIIPNQIYAPKDMALKISEFSCSILYFSPNLDDSNKSTPTVCVLNKDETIANLNLRKNDKLIFSKSAYLQANKIIIFGAQTQINKSTRQIDYNYKDNFFTKVDLLPEQK